MNIQNEMVLSIDEWLCIFINYMEFLKICDFNYDLPHFKFVYGPIEEKFWHIKQDNDYHQSIHGTKSGFVHWYVS